MNKDLGLDFVFKTKQMLSWIYCFYIINLLLHVHCTRCIFL